MKPLVTFGTMAWGIVNVAAAASSLRCLMYLTGQHNVVPPRKDVRAVTHVALAFMRSDSFNDDQVRESWPLFTTVSETRVKFQEGTKVMVAIGGWGDTAGFSTAAQNRTSQARFARNVAAMVAATGADGVDIDWEYPGGNGEDYKQVPNSEKVWEIEAYPLLLAELRAALGPDKIISAAVPGLERDMLAFTPATVPRIMESLTFLNVMTYDMMNRRDNVTKHHTGVALSLAAVDAYISRGARPDSINLGFAFYTKWFRTQECERGHEVGCPTVLMEDPATGADLGGSGGFAWHDPVPKDVAGSFERALAHGQYDAKGGGHYYWDADERRWWTFDNPDAIRRKFPKIVEARGLGGVFSWGLGEDAPEWRHLKALNEGLTCDEHVRDEL